ncbi:Cystathionine gamma-lyase [Trichoplax sp. H2]|uniref:cystathionine gamma-lyase n=1 Tax=Trichoplax adhaerens TaxID=10228 RepID=B3S3W7_TRIAD|nr:expressed hypothetical protein [Trichoplax adhaerens]EDV22541.1 expressed hypothetical protein [Trichoplax adhaerens]RDD43677.1 Cystathionine gamma-lyase [Trichoplax sp. H2]|eukprot:XP_002115085.1 expressed hypothetical protein [Trichoplax adhaerens]
MSTFEHFATNAIHVGQSPDQWKSMSMIPQISLSTTFKQHAPGDNNGYEYTRGGNPTRKVFEKCVASLEGAKHALAFSSGLGATTSIVHLLKSGDHIVSVNDVYGGTNRYFQKVCGKFGVTATFVDTSDLKNIEAAIQPNTRMMWLESPTNPTLKVTDLEGASKIAHAHKDIIVVVDNTFASSYFQRPLSLGADIVMHSVTKYMNGHTDVLMGVAVTNSDEINEKLFFLQFAMGIVPSPFDCYLANRGVKTLAIRMKQHQANAFAVAKFLESSPYVEKVLYPGLPSHPQHEIAKKQMKGFSGMVTFYAKGDAKTAARFFKNIKIFTLAESLGGYESLAELPSLMTHASVPEKQRAELGITDTLIRLSVGIEETEDLVADLEQALAAAQVEN